MGKKQMSPKPAQKAASGIRLGLNKGFMVTRRETPVRRASAKSRSSPRVVLIREVIGEVMGCAPFRGMIELLKIGSASTMKRSLKLAKKRLGTHKVQMKVCNLQWSHDCIKINFRNGSALVDLLQECLNDPSIVQRIPLFDVVEHEGHRYALTGNRRLWVLKEYAFLKDPDLAIRVRVRTIEHNNEWARLFKMRFTTQNCGQRIEFVLEHRRGKSERYPTMALALRAKMRVLGPQTRVRDDSADTSLSSRCSPCSPARTNGAARFSVWMRFGSRARSRSTSRAISRVARVRAVAGDSGNGTPVLPMQPLVFQPSVVAPWRCPVTLPPWVNR